MPGQWGARAGRAPLLDPPMGNARLFMFSTMGIKLSKHSSIPTYYKTFYSCRKLMAGEKRVLFMESVMSIQQMDFNLQNQMSISRAIYAHT